MEVISTEPGWITERAATLLRAITQFEFLISFVVVKHEWIWIYKRANSVTAESPARYL